MIFTKPTEKQMQNINKDMKLSDNDDFDYFDSDPTEEEVNHLIESMTTKVKENMEIYKSKE